MAGMSDQAYATKARDIVAGIAESVVNRMRPESKIAQVYSVTGNKAEVLFAGEVFPNTVTAKFPPYLTPQNPILQTDPTNLAYAKPVAINGIQAASNVLQSGITDGDTTSNNYYTLEASTAAWVQVDLGSVQTVDRIVVWHYYTDGRTFHNTKVDVSSDGVTYQTIFDSAVSGEYAEPTNGAGKTHTFFPRPVRYIRAWANGSTVSAFTHWVEIKAFNDSGRGDIVRVSGKPGNYYIEGFISGSPKPHHLHPIVTQVQHTWGSATPNNTNTTVQFDSEVSDPHGFHQTNSTRLTCPTGMQGWYDVKVTFGFQAAGGNGWRKGYLYKNGAVITANSWHPAYSAESSASITTYMNVGDYIESVLYQDSGGYLNMHTSYNTLALYQFVGAAT